MRRSRYVTQAQPPQEQKQKQEQEQKQGTRNPLVPFVIAKNKKELKLTSAMKQNYCPKYDESVIIIGGSGSGKTTLLLWMLTQSNIMPITEFDETWLFSFTGEADKSFEVLQIPKKNIVTENLEGKINEVFLKQKKTAEKSRGKQKKMLMILEDVTSSYKLIRSTIFTKLFTAGRHYGITVIAVAHKYSSISRVGRLSAMNIFAFPCPMTEIESIVADHCAACLTKKEMIKLVQYAFDAGDDIERPFLYIPTTQPFKTRYRRGMHQILELK
jgi:hypothetical protein